MSYSTELDFNYYLNKYNLEFSNYDAALLHYNKIGKSKGFYPNIDTEIYLYKLKNFDKEYYYRKYWKFVKSSNDSLSHWKNIGFQKKYFVNACDENNSSISNNFLEFKHIFPLCTCKIVQNESELNINTIENKNDILQSDVSTYSFNKNNNEYTITEHNTNECNTNECNTNENIINEHKTKELPKNEHIKYNTRCNNDLLNNDLLNNNFNKHNIVETNCIINNNSTEIEESSESNNISTKSESECNLFTESKSSESEKHSDHKKYCNHHNNCQNHYNHNTSSSTEISSIYESSESNMTSNSKDSFIEYIDSSQNITEVTNDVFDNKSIISTEIDDVTNEINNLKNKLKKPIKLVSSKNKHNTSFLSNSETNTSDNDSNYTSDNNSEYSSEYSSDNYTTECSKCNESSEYTQNCSDCERSNMDIKNKLTNHAPQYTINYYPPELPKYEYPNNTVDVDKNTNKVKNTNKECSKEFNKKCNIDYKSNINKMIENQYNLIDKNIETIIDYLKHCGLHIELIINILQQVYTTLTDISGPVNYILYNASRVRISTLLSEIDNIIENASYNGIPLLYSKLIKNCSHSIKFPIHKNTVFEIDLPKVSLSDLKLSDYTKQLLNKNECMTSKSNPLPQICFSIDNTVDKKYYNEHYLIKNFKIETHLDIVEKALYKVTMYLENINNYTKLILMKKELYLKLKMEKCSK